MDVILCGYNWTGCKGLQLLMAEGHNVFVFTHEGPYHIPSLIEYCKEENVPYSTEKISISNIPFVPDAICSIYYRYIIPEGVIGYCKGKVFNLHPSLLPQYAGCGSLTWAMINGETEVGYTYHYVTPDIDAGRIILGKRIGIEDFDTQETLYNRVMFEAMKDFNEAFNLVTGGFAGQEQTGEKSYYKRGCPNNGEIDTLWDEAKIKRFIRAMIYPPYPVAMLNGNPIKTYSEFQKQITAK